VLRCAERSHTKRKMGKKRTLASTKIRPKKATQRVNQEDANQAKWWEQFSKLNNQGNNELLDAEGDFVDNAEDDEGIDEPEYERVPRKRQQEVSEKMPVKIGGKVVSRKQLAVEADERAEQAEDQEEKREDGRAGGDEGNGEEDAGPRETKEEIKKRVLEKRLEKKRKRKELQQERVRSSLAACLRVCVHDRADTISAEEATTARRSAARAS
jgi:hypothetical protein